MGLALALTGPKNANHRERLAIVSIMKLYYSSKQGGYQSAAYISKQTQGIGFAQPLLAL